MYNYNKLNGFIPNVYSKRKLASAVLFYLSEVILYAEV